MNIQQQNEASTMSLFDKDEVAQIIAGHGDWFGAVLIRLIAKADNSNRQRLYTVFPEQVNAVHRYQTGHDWAETDEELMTQGERELSACGDDPHGD
jgi:hypothetical protein